MKLNGFYIFIVLLAVFMVFVSLRYFRGSRHSSVGIAHTQHYNINAEKPAMVKSINVIAGQQVKKGDLLVELSSQSLDIEIARIENTITALRSEQREKAKLADSEIAFTRADLGVRVEELNSEIQQAESEMRLNRNLTRQFGSDEKKSDDADPVEAKVEALKQQRARQQEAIDIKVKDILQEKQTEQRLVIDRIDLLEKELQMLTNEKNSLRKYASADGLVQTIFVRQGEQVNAFTSLLSIQPVSPTTVIGYQMGNKEPLGVGQSVTVTSFDRNNLSVSGKVIGYGAVVLLPEILQKSTAVKSFGREMFIEIPVPNALASGEKVLIR